MWSGKLTSKSRRSNHRPSQYHISFQLESNFVSVICNFSISLGEIIGFPEWGSGVSWRRSLRVNLLLLFAVADIWGFLLLNPYWLLHALGKTPKISHATTTGLESAGKKQLNPTVPKVIENLQKVSPTDWHYAIRWYGQLEITLRHGCLGRSILSKDDLIQLEGVVNRVLGGGTMEIQCDNDITVRGVLSGRMKKYRIKVMVGDRVQVSVSPYDTSHGLITYRF